MDPIISAIVNNPALFAAVIALIRNLGGYIVKLLHIRGFEKWDKMQALETLALYETFFLALQGIAGIPGQYTAIIVVILDAIRNLKLTLQKA
jgi:hypothetical protein